MTSRSEGGSISGLSIRAQSVHKQFVDRNGHTVQALNVLSHTIEAGEFFSLVGPSGCGKSTFLRVVAGLIRPTGGQVFLGDGDVEKPSDRVGIVFQKPVLLSWKTVLQNVTLPLVIARRLDKEGIEKARSLLETVGLGDYCDRYPGELSGGMQQRASIARALVKDPDVILMDEPFSALDEFTRESLNEELLRILGLRKSTALFITHSISEAVFMSDRVGIMTSSPGTLRKVFTIDLPRPRNRGIRGQSEYYEYVRSVRQVLDEAQAAREVENEI